MKVTRFLTPRFVRVARNIALLFFAGMLGALAAARQDGANSQQGHTLEIGKPIERRMAAGEIHPYEVRLTKGQFLRAVFDQRGIDVVVDVIGPEGDKIASIDSPNGTQGPELVELEAKASGVYRLVVRALEPNAVAGLYEAKLQTVLNPEEYASLLAKAKAQHVDPPNGWFTTPAATGDCKVVTDTATAHGGRASAQISCNGYDGRGFEVYRSLENLMQIVRADAYRGQRVRLSAWIKQSRVEQSARFWMRVDGTDQTLSFDNMERSLIKGSGDWQRREIVLDVPHEAMTIIFGVLLDGKGTVWADDFQLEKVQSDAHSTNMAESVAQQAKTPWTRAMLNQAQRQYSRAPMELVNLNFEEPNSQGRH
jgi:hypothetical protein